jgi:hypothetical protein
MRMKLFLHIAASSFETAAGLNDRRQPIHGNGHRIPSHPTIASFTVYHACQISTASYVFRVFLKKGFRHGFGRRFRVWSARRETALAMTGKLEGTFDDYLVIPLPTSRKRSDEVTNF